MIQQLIILTIFVFNQRRRKAILVRGSKSKTGLFFNNICKCT